MLHSRTKLRVNAYAAGITLVLFMASCTPKKLNISPQKTEASLTTDERAHRAESPPSNQESLATDEHGNRSESPPSNQGSLGTGEFGRYTASPQRGPLSASPETRSRDDEDEGWISGSLGFASSAKTAFDGEIGEYGYTRSDLALDFAFLEVGYQRYDFSWTDAETLDFSNGATEPWSQLQTLSLSGSIPFQIRENMMLMTSLGVTMGWEEETSDALSYEASVGFMWEKSDTLMFMFGLAYSWHPDVNLRNEIFPMIGLSWREGVEKGWSASFGVPNTEVRYAFNKNSSLAFGLDGDGGVFRLADNSMVAPKGYVEWNQFAAGLNFRQHFGKNWALEAGATYSFEDEWRFFNADGTRFDTKKADSSLGFHLRLNWRF